MNDCHVSINHTNINQIIDQIILCLPLVTSSSLHLAKIIFTHATVNINIATPEIRTSINKIIFQFNVSSNAEEKNKLVAVLQSSQLLILSLISPLLSG